MGRTNGGILRDKANMWKQGTPVGESSWISAGQFPVAMTPKGVPTCRALAAVKRVKVELDNGEVEIVELGAQGPKVLTWDGREGFLEGWLQMTSTEREVMIHTVAKKNRARREAIAARPVPPEGTLSEAIRRFG
eukprot:TRINITY_DN7384_c0_g1_i1.p2 TRINITY_DN7384_c0_g1~~TRINITY_DN7384_c0_g1_i1.p2  ORF type:complete len:134 (-),score=23.15 TRINITY_DN7384_c0_g1_i1:235-636(-)